MMTASLPRFVIFPFCPVWVILIPCQLRLMNFIRRIGRDEIYIKYVHQLVNVGVILPLPVDYILAQSADRCICNLRTTSRQPLL